jgi:hypothetical protein
MICGTHTFTWGYTTAGHQEVSKETTEYRTDFLLAISMTNIKVSYVTMY